MNAENPGNPMHEAGRLAHFPVSLISVVMGLTGLAIAWQKAQHALGASPVAWLVLAVLASATFVALLGLYALKMQRFPDAVRAEWRHPVRVNFFPTISISLLLLGIVWLETTPAVAMALWVVGSVIHLLFTFAILSSWMYHTHYDIKHANPWMVHSRGRQPVRADLRCPFRFAGSRLVLLQHRHGVLDCADDDHLLPCHLP